MPMHTPTPSHPPASGNARGEELLRRFLEESPPRSTPLTPEEEAALVAWAENSMRISPDSPEALHGEDARALGRAMVAWATAAEDPGGEI